MSTQTADLADIGFSLVDFSIVIHNENICTIIEQLFYTELPFDTGRPTKIEINSILLLYINAFLRHTCWELEIFSGKKCVKARGPLLA